MTYKKGDNGWELQASSRWNKRDVVAFTVVDPDACSEQTPEAQVASEIVSKDDTRAKMLQLASRIRRIRKLGVKSVDLRMVHNLGEGLKLKDLESDVLGRVLGAATDLADSGKAVFDEISKSLGA